MALIKEQFLQHLEDLFSSLKREHPFYQKVWQRFIALGLPEKEEAFQYLHLRSLYAKSFSLQKPSEARDVVKKDLLLQYPDEPLFVFYNGCFSPECSTANQYYPDLVVEPLEKAFNEYEAFIHQYLEQYLRKEKDPFSLLAFALQQGGLFFYLPPYLQLQQPIRVIEIVEDAHETIIAPVILGCLGKKSALQLIHHFSPHTQGLATVSTHFSLAEQASLLQIHCPVKNEAWRLESHRYHLSKESNLKCIQVTLSPFVSRTHLQVLFTGQEAKADLSGFWVLKEQEQMHTHVLVEHQAPSCSSSQLFKGILHQESRSSFEGKIYIHPEAQKTQSYQLNKNCLLSSQAQCYSKPNLEIFADDVKASHGSTTGLLDTEALFYLMARGISRTQAEELMLTAFCQDVIEKIEIPSLKEEAQKALVHDA